MEFQQGFLAVRTIDNAADPGHSGVILDGARMTTRDELFDQFAATFNFPDHFGRNWDAFNDCMRDHLDDGKETPVTILISRASLLLVDAIDRDLSSFLSTLNNVSQEYGNGLVMILADDDAHVARVHERLRRVEAPFTEE
jgi:RNAse (barnase) inhibitor barstar